MARIARHAVLLVLSVAGLIGPAALAPGASAAVGLSTAAGLPGPSVPLGLDRATRRFHVDCAAGDDTRAGTSPATAWRTTAAVNRRTFRPGDAIALRAGCTFDGGLRINGSGTQAAPLLVTAYGGASRPWVSNTGGGQHGVGIDVYGNHVLIDGLGIRDVHDAGVRFLSGTSHGVAQNLEITGTGTGVMLAGSFGLAAHNDVHDLHLVVDTPRSQNADDDSGAVGFVVSGPDNEVAWNRCTRCEAPSDDYGTDGGFVEVWNSADRLFVHHNVATRTSGFFELGGENSSHHANDVRVMYNVLNDVGIALMVHRSGRFGIGVTNLVFENNTSVQTRPGYPTISFQGVTPQDLIVRNNIFTLDSPGLVLFAGGGTFTHDNNLYAVGRDARVGLVLDPTERVAAPGFRNAAAADFRLSATSAARAAGLALGYAMDLDGRPVNLARPSLGAYES